MEEEKPSPGNEPVAPEGAAPVPKGCLIALVVWLTLCMIVGATYKYIVQPAAAKHRARAQAAEGLVEARAQLPPPSVRVMPPKTGAAVQSPPPNLRPTRSVLGQLQSAPSKHRHALLHELNRRVEQGDLGDAVGWLPLLALEDSRELAKRAFHAAGTGAGPALEKGLVHPAPGVREHAVRLLLQTDREQVPNAVVAVLSELVSSGQPDDKRRWALQKMAKYHRNVPTETVQKLVSLLPERMPAATRRQLHSVLITVGGVSVPALIAALATDKNTDTQILDILKRMRDPKQTLALCKVLQEENPARRQAAATALKRVAGYWSDIGEAAKPLGWLLFDPDARNRVVAADALKAMKEKAEPATLDLVNALADRKVSGTAKWTLVNIGTPAIVPLLDGLKGADPNHRRACLDVLDELADLLKPEHCPVLIATLADEEYLAHSARKLLQQVGAPVVANLAEAVKKPSRNRDEEKFRERIILTLSNLEEDAAASVGTLAHILVHDQSWSVRQKAAAALGGMGAKAQKELVAAVLAIEQKGGDRSDQQCAIAGVEALALPGLITIYRKANDDGLRRASIEGIKRLKTRSPKALPVLIDALDDRDQMCRREAAEALGKFGEEAAPAIPKLIKLLQENNYHARRAAIESLGRIGRPARTAVPAIKAIKDQNAHKREIAEALKAIGD